MSDLLKSVIEALGIPFDEANVHTRVWVKPMPIDPEYGALWEGVEMRFDKGGNLSLVEPQDQIEEIRRLWREAGVI